MLSTDMTGPSLPATCPSCGATLTPGAAFCIKCGTATGVPPEPESSVLERLKTALADRYRIERQLGAGGMATVFLAHDLRHERDVAIKVLHPELAASMGVERFDREIKLAAKLHHPHILSLFDSGEAAGLLFYVMPFVPGESLRDRLDRESMLPVDDALQITYEVADALGAAHALGIVHRDIKPENILLAGGHALVADFGVARAASEAGEKLTQTGMAVGTPLYMSPEQAMGDAVGPTSDLYSLGCVAFEMLTGQPPFTGANARAIMARHTMEAVPGIRLVRDTVPEEVEGAILAVLAKVPADRPQSAKEFLELLAAPGDTGATRRLGSRITTARRVSGSARRKPWWRRPVAWVAAAVVLLAAGGGALLLTRHKAPAAGLVGGLDPTHVAVLYFRDESQGGKLGYVADGLTEGLIRALKEVPTLDVVSSGGAAAYRNSALSPDSIARALGVGTLVTGNIDESGGRLHVTVRLIDGASGAEFARAGFDQPATNLIAVGDTLVADAARLIRRRLGQEIRLADVRDQARDPQAWSLYEQAQGLRKAGEASSDTLVTARDFEQADSLLALAETLDPKWPGPPILQGQLDYLRSRSYGLGDPPASNRWILRGLGHADAALAVDRNDPDALELRGNLRYWRWLLGIVADPDSAHQLLLDAKSDLETATSLNPAQAGAWATLSHLYYQTGSLPDVYLAARHALEEDAYLDNADKIVQRLFYSSYDLGQLSDAERWCGEGRRRFPADPVFTECRLWLLTTRQDSADPQLAWRLLDSVVALTPPDGRAYQRLYDQALVAGVLARAGAADSARHLLRRTVADAKMDATRDLTYVKAMMYVLLNDTSDAVSQLSTYLAANPSKRKGLAQDPGWQFQSIANDPRFIRLVGSPR
jgi:eukaryotic-like serine/threonine-protein kinase